MKELRRLKFISLAVLSLSLLFSCGGGSDVTPADSPNAQKFFPTSVGSSWTYNDPIGLIKKTVISSGYSPQIRTDEPDGAYSIDTYAWQSDALYLSKWERFDNNNNGLYSFISITFSPPALRLPSNIKDGVHETSHASTGYQNLTIDISVSAYGTVTVPAGAFDNCMMITEIDTIVDLQNGQTSMETITTWVAESVGVVKKNWDFSGVSGTDELVSYLVKQDQAY
jgi:hypothetical protein